MKRLLVAVLLIASATPASAQSERYRAEVHISGEAKRWPDLSLWTATVVDSTGREVYTLRKEIPFDISLPAVAVAGASPWSVVVSACEGWVEFYDTTGTLAGTWRAFESPVPDYERIIKCALAGERIAFLVSEPAGGKARVYLADRRGNVSFYTTLPYQDAGELWLSPDGTHLVAGCTSFDERLEESTRVIDLRTGDFYEFPMQFRRVDLSRDRRRYVIAGADRIVSGDLGAGAPEWEWRSREADCVVSSVCLAGTGVVAVVDRVEIIEGRPMYVRATLMVLDTQGAVVARDELTGRSDRPSRLTVVHDDAAVTLGQHSVHVRLPARLLDR